MIPPRPTDDDADTPAMVLLCDACRVVYLERAAADPGTEEDRAQEGRLCLLCPRGNLRWVPDHMRAVSTGRS